MDYFSNLNAEQQNELKRIRDAFMNDFAKFASGANNRNNKVKHTTTGKSLATGNYKNYNSTSVYKNAIKKLDEDLSQKINVDFIKSFCKIIALLYNFGHLDYAKKVVAIAYYHILSLQIQKKNHTTGTAIKDFVDFVNKKKQKRKNANIQIIKWASQIVKRIIQDIDDYPHLFYSRSDLIQIMTIRLRGQDRTSGEKIWLPLGVLSKIYNPLSSTKPSDKTFIEWIHSIANTIYIHYEKNGKVNSIQLKDIAALDFEGDKNEEKKVYVILIKGGRYEALTPLGILNHKDYLKAVDIDGVVIDHIKPIDLTLRDLGNSNQLENPTIQRHFKR